MLDHTFEKKAAGVIYDPITPGISPQAPPPVDLGGGKGEPVDRGSIYGAPIIFIYLSLKK